LEACVTRALARAVTRAAGAHAARAFTLGVAGAGNLATLALDVRLATLDARVAATRAVRHGAHQRGALRRLQIERDFGRRPHLRLHFAHDLDRRFASGLAVSEIALRAEVLGEVPAGDLQVTVDLGGEALEVERRSDAPLQLGASGRLELELLRPVKLGD